MKKLNNLKVDVSDFDKLKNYGFEKINDAWKKENFITDYNQIFYHDGYALDLGESRRGQRYYLEVSLEGEVFIFASDAEGDGGQLLLNEAIYHLIKDGVFQIDKG